MASKIRHQYPWTYAGPYDKIRYLWPLYSLNINNKSEECDLPNSSSLCRKAIRKHLLSSAIEELSLKRALIFGVTSQEFHPSLLTI